MKEYLLTCNSNLQFTISIPLFFSVFFYLAPHPSRLSWVGRNRPCPWTPVGRSCGLATLKCSRPTWRPWERLRSEMERGCCWVSKTWAAVRSTPRPSNTAPMGGETVVGGSSGDVKILEVHSKIMGSRFSFLFPLTKICWLLCTVSLNTDRWSVLRLYKSAL